MKGLYILTTNILKLHNTIKFGMSMRLEYRWIDYLSIFNDAEYLYYYEFIDDITKEHILYIEDIIITHYKEKRNKDFQTEYFMMLDNLELFHQYINKVLQENNINYVEHKGHNFIKTHYDNKPDSLTYMKINKELYLRNKIQNEYLEEIKDTLIKNTNAFLKAPTGFGKTHIYYKLIKMLNFKKVLFLTPRLLLNEQIVEDKYISYITDYNYKIFHYSHAEQNKKESIINKISKKNKFIMTSCYQSGKKLLENIIKYNVKFDLIIFDEAHFITSWQESTSLMGFLTNNNNICSYRLFGSATPTDIIETNSLLYGKIIEKIKVYELMNMEILCNIETIVKQLNNTKTEYHNLKDLIVSSMTRYNKKKGIIYVNNINNAKNLFELMKSQNIINTYIYVSKDIENITEDDTDIKKFELDNNMCIIIAVGKISYGYDNPYIDFICLGDPRQSDIDIRQIIGRGIRWNKQLYPHKVLHLLIPLYMDEFGNNMKNEHLKKYLDYIISECGQDIIFKSSNKLKIGQCENRNNKDKDYDGEEIPIEILNEYCTTGYNKFTDFMRFLKSNNIFDENLYNELRSTQEWMPLISTIREKYPKFCFKDINPNNINYYWDKCDAIKAFEIAKNELIKIIGKEKFSDLTFQQIYKKINNINNKIPLVDFDLYY